METMFEPVHPGRIIRDDYLEPLELTVVQMAKSLKISRQTLTAILNQRAGVSPEMALRLAEALDTTPELWINMQRSYDLYIAKQKYTAKGKIEKLYIAEMA